MQHPGTGDVAFPVRYLARNVSQERMPRACPGCGLPHDRPHRTQPDRGGLMDDLKITLIL